MMASKEEVGKVPGEELWGEQARDRYAEMKRKRLNVAGVVVAKKGESYEAGETIRVVVEKQADEVQLIIGRSILGESSDDEELRWKEIEKTWQVWQEEAEKGGDEEVREWLAGMRRDLFDVD